MARFRKGTTDHDNDGRMGGSLKRGSRFVPGTMDHDSDGMRGGSLPQGDEPMARKTTKKADKPAATKQSINPQSGMEAGNEGARKKAIDEQFAEADGKGDPRYDETAAGLAVRGY